MSKGDSRSSTPWILTALTWWTFAGTCIAVVGLFTHVPKSGLLWPTMIQPSGLGAGIGAAVFLVLVAVIGALGDKKTDGEEPQAGD